MFRFPSGIVYCAAPVLFRSAFRRGEKAPVTSGFFSARQRAAENKPGLHCVNNTCEGAGGCAACSAFPPVLFTALRPSYFAPPSGAEKKHPNLPCVPQGGRGSLTAPPGPEVQGSPKGAWSDLNVGPAFGRGQPGKGSANFRAPDDGNVLPAGASPPEKKHPI